LGGGWREGGAFGEEIDFFRIIPERKSHTGHGLTSHEKRGPVF